jgi:hypothetical protein
MCVFRFVFSVVSPGGKAVYLQAENAILRDNWISRINMMSKDFKSLMDFPNLDASSQKFVYFERAKERSDSEGSDEDGDYRDATSRRSRGTDQFLWGSATNQVMKDSTEQAHPITVPRSRIKPVR